MTTQQPIVVPGPNHLLHIILSVLTGGLWLIIYVPILIRAGRRQKQAYKRAANTQEQIAKQQLKTAKAETKAAREAAVQVQPEA